MYQRLCGSGDYEKEDANGMKNSTIKSSEILEV